MPSIQLLALVLFMAGMYIHMNVTMEDLAASITMDMQAANWKQRWCVVGGGDS